MSTPSVERARLHVPCGPLADALAPRFVRALAAHSTLGIDRVDEAVLIVEAIGRHCEALLSNGALDLSVRVVDGGLELIAGPFARGTPRRMLDADVGYDGSIGRLGVAEIRAGRDGRERLHVAIA